MKFFNKKRLFVLLGGIALVFAAAITGLFIFVHSPGFEERARDVVVREIQDRTGAHVSVKHIEWDLWKQRFQVEDLIVRGTEPQTAPPMAAFPQIEIGLNLRSLFQRKINLFELTFTRPEFHISVDADGKTNLPTPATQSGQSLNFEFSIESFKILEGTTFLNEREIDTDFRLTNLASESSYQTTRGILSSHLRFDGRLQHSDQPVIPYTFDADLDYTNGTLLPHRIDLKSGSSVLKLQGRINDLLKPEIAGRLEYTGNAQLPFLNYFFEHETFAGNAAMAGYLEFARGMFATNGTATSNFVEFDGWTAKAFRADYHYNYPDRQASFTNLRASIAGGKASGSVTVENIPGLSRVQLDIHYADVDAAALARAYPWDHKYRISSNITGTLQGWFEGRLDRYVFSGDAAFKPHDFPAIEGILPLALDGSTKYELRPEEARVSNSDVRFGSTHIKAAGLIEGKASDLKVAMESADLRDGTFIYGDANGSGSFDGALTGPIRNPVFSGDFALHDHLYQKRWPIKSAVGHVQLDTLTETATIEGVHVTQGRSEVVLSGTTKLNGSAVDLNVQALRVAGEDITPFAQHKIGGMLAGGVRLTSFTPLKVEGDLRVDNLQIDDHLVGNTRGHFRYFEPQIELTSLSVARNEATLTGDALFNRSTEALRFSVRVAALNFDSIRFAGLPDSLNGVIRQAYVQGNGTLTQPNVQGNTTLQNLTFKGQVFPQVGIEVTSSGSTLDTTITAARNLTLAAHINTAIRNFPFAGNATFTSYSLEQLAGLEEGTLNATGSAAISGFLKDPNSFKGTGQVDSLNAVVQGQSIHATRPFTFDFNSDHLTLSSVTLTGQATEVSLAGTVGFTDQATLGLDVQGRVDLSLLAAANSDWIAGGAANLNGRVRGTPQNPDLRGFAHFTNASFTRRGLFTSVTALNGDVFFDGNRITLNGIQGSVGGGTVKLEGNAVLQQKQLRAMNIRIENSNVRLRYPEGLRTVVDGSLVLRGSLDAPVLEGNLQIVSMSYKSSFEEFLALFNSVGQQQAFALGQMRLGLHVQGGKNITIQNQLASVEARVDLDIKGTVDHPALTGHVEASGGTLSFQGKKYTITRGNVDFVDPLRIDPAIDVQAETDVRDYRVILGITGRGDRLHLDMHSDPPLSQVEIVSLISGGKTMEELEAEGSAVPTSDAMFKSGATSILGDLLQEKIAGSAFERLGLTRVRIGPDPTLVTTASQTNLRLTVEKQVSKDLSVTYSQDLSSSSQRIIQIEYFISKNTSLLASRDETNGYGLDIKFRKRIK